MCTFLLYIHTFYLINYIYTHNQKKKKKNLVFSIKIIFDGDLSQNKIHFFHFHSQILKKFHFKYRLSNFMLKVSKKIFPLN